MSSLPAGPSLSSERARPAQKGPISWGAVGFLLPPPDLFPHPGKCSHGGRFDQSSSQPPRGGINKDSTAPGFSPHHTLHLQAAELALLASTEAFGLLWSRLGDRGFSR